MKISFKKLLVASICMVMLVGCGNDKEEDTSNNDTNQNETEEQEEEFHMSEENRPTLWIENVEWGEKKDSIPLELYGGTFGSTVPIQSNYANSDMLIGLVDQPLNVILNPNTLGLETIPLNGWKELYLEDESSLKVITDFNGTKELEVFEAFQKGLWCIEEIYSKEAFKFTTTEEFIDAHPITLPTYDEMYAQSLKEDGEYQWMVADYIAKELGKPDYFLQNTQDYPEDSYYTLKDRYLGAHVTYVWEYSDAVLVISVDENFSRYYHEFEVRDINYYPRKTWDTALSNNSGVINVCYAKNLTQELINNKVYMEELGLDKVAISLSNFY